MVYRGPCKHTHGVWCTGLSCRTRFVIPVPLCFAKHVTSAKRQPAQKRMHVSNLVMFTTCNLIVAFVSRSSLF